MLKILFEIFVYSLILDKNMKFSRNKAFILDNKKFIYSIWNLFYVVFIDFKDRNSTILSSSIS